MARRVVVVIVGVVAGTWAVSAGPASRPKGAVVGAYRYVGRDAVGKVPFYSEYNAQNDEDRAYHGDHASWVDNLNVITEYSTFFPITLRSADEPEKMRRALDLTRRAFARRQLIAYMAYGTEGVDRLAALLDEVGKCPDGRDIIRNVFAAHLGDEPYLAGRSPEQMDRLVAYFDRKIQSRHGHIQSWLNFAVSTPQVKTWGTGKDGLKRLPKGLDIVSIDWYAFVGNGRKDNWGRRDFRRAEKELLSLLPRFLDDQTRRMKAAIAAVYKPGEEPMMILLGNSSYVRDITHPTPVSVQDAYFEYVRRTEWAGLMWWTFEDFKEFIGGRHHEIIRAHQRHGQRIRQEKLH